MSSDGQIAQKKHRHSKACTRCRKRKIRCDFQYPTCGACSSAGATCLGFDSIQGVERPRSTISHLEQEVARLETELAVIQSQTKTDLDVAIEAAEHLSTRLAAAIVMSPRSFRNQEPLLPLTSKYFLSGSPEPYLSGPAIESGVLPQNDETSVSTNKLSSIPRHAVDTMLKHYCEIYRPLYPAIEELDLFNASDRVYNNTEPSAFDIFCVHITLAISMQTLMYTDERRATSASYGFWSTAVDALGQVGPFDPWERLQALQLLTHYAFTNPKHADCSKCAAAATRLCLQLGLQHALPSSVQDDLDSGTLRNRKRLFWNSYNIDCAVHTVQCRPFVWPKTVSIGQFSETDSQSATSRQFCLLRELESDVTRGMYYPNIHFDDIPRDHSFVEWFTRLQQRLDEWYQTTRQSINLGEKIEFHELLFQCQVLRLNRPSPCCPKPTKEMRKRALQASIAVLKELGIIERMGKLFNIWHAGYYLIEAVICLLGTVLTEMGSQRDAHTTLDGEDIPILCRYIQTAPALLKKISRRWPNIAVHASAIEALSRAVIDALHLWSKSDSVDQAEITALKSQLNQFSLFSPLPKETESSVQTYIPSGTPELYAAPSGNPVSESVKPLFDHLDLQVSGVTAASNSDWALSNSVQDQASSVIPEPYDFDMGSDLLWDFDGIDTEEILAAFLEVET